MKGKRASNGTQGHRSGHGQAVVEGTAMMVVMILAVVLLGYLIVNTSLIGGYNYRLNAVAAEASRQMNAGKWWMGMRRMFYMEDRAQGDVKALVEAELAMMGIKKEQISPISFVETPATVNGQTVKVVRVSFDVSGLPTVSGGFFPATVTLHATGVSSDAEFAVAKHGMALIETVDPVTHVARGIRVPIYNATQGHNTPADTSTNAPWLHAGKTNIGTYPTVELNLYAKHSGLLHQEMTPGPNQTTITGTKPWPDMPQS